MTMRPIIKNRMVVERHCFMSMNKTDGSPVSDNQASIIPLVSVCIPVYNGEKYIKETIQSVISQRYDNIEIIVQDNASTDATWNILKDLAQTCPQLSLKRNERNEGMAPNWNLAINRACGDYIMLLSADDLLAPGFLTACLKVIQNASVDIVTTDHFLLRKGVKVKRKISVAQGDYRNFAGTVLLLNPFSINFSLFKKETITRLKREGRLFSESFFTCDYDLWIRAALSGINVHYIEQPLGTYRVHESNISRQVIRMNRQAALVILRHRDELRRQCGISYRFTLFRFIIRIIRNAIIFRRFDKRMFFALSKEAVSADKM